MTVACALRMMKFDINFYATNGDEGIFNQRHSPARQTTIKKRMVPYYLDGRNNPNKAQRLNPKRLVTVY
jgi:hypothetical protein